MVGYCKNHPLPAQLSAGLFRRAPHRGCGNCSNCTGEFVQTDITTEAQKILSGVARIQKRWPGGLGLWRWCRYCAAPRIENPWSAGWTRFPTYGIMPDVPPQRMRLYLDALQEQGYLARKPAMSSIIHLTAKAPAVLFHGEQVTMQERAATAQNPGQAPCFPQRRLPAPHFRKRTIRCWQA